MGRSWYYDSEDEMDERNESFGKDFIESKIQKKPEILKSNTMAKLYTHRNGQISFFEEIIVPEPQAQPKCNEINNNRRIEYIRLTKRGPTIIERRYIEEYEADN